MNLPDKRYFINQLPKFELSYDFLLHNKVLGKYFRLIPKGNKCVIYFTNFNNRNLCICMYLNKYNLVTNYSILKCSFDKKLSYGTIFLGVLSEILNYKFISVIDILKYQGVNILDYTNQEKIQLTFKILKEQINQYPITKEFVIFLLPIYSDSIKNAHISIQNVNYDIEFIEFLDINYNSFGSIINKNIKNKFCIFKVKASLQDDIYEIYCSENKKDIFYSHYLIPDYKTSVFMNSIFRDIKENKNLDLLEMSEDEEEFENIDIDKYVNLKKTIYMKSLFNKKFKKWQPIEIVDKPNILLTKNQIKNLE